MWPRRGLVRSGAAVNTQHRWRTAAFALVATVLGCRAETRTMLVVEVGSNLLVPGELTKVEVVVKKGGVIRQRIPFSLLLSEHRLPVRAGLIAVDDQHGQELEISAVGLRDADPVVSEDAVVAFIEGQSMLLRLFLARECRINACRSDQTCTFGGACRIRTRSPADLQPFDPANVPLQMTDTGSPIASRDGSSQVPPVPPGMEAGIEAGGREVVPDASGPLPDAPVDLRAETPVDVAGSRQDLGVSADVPIDAPKDVTDVPGCVPECPIGGKRCGAEGGVQTCTLIQGCPTWGPEMACPSPRTCRGSAPNATCGCSAPPLGCAGGAGTFCESAGVVATCAMDAQGCIGVSGKTTCPAGKPCIGGHPMASCSCAAPPTECVAGAGTSCQGNTLATCAIDENGCIALRSKMTCPGITICNGVAPDARCACPSMPPQCNGASGTFCSSGSVLATCGVDTSGCVAVVATATCANGCTGAHPIATCCSPACTGKCGGPDGCGGTCPNTCAAPQTCGGGGTENVCGAGPCFTQVSTGGIHTCARKTDGSLWCWGANLYGEATGDGSANMYNPASAAKQITALGTNVVEVAAGYVHTCARKTDGTLWCWGDDLLGQVGDGTAGSPRLSPLQVTALGTSVAEVAAGTYNTCARKTDGTLWCWGDNQFGQIGDGTVVRPRPLPLQVMALGTNAAGVVTGESTCSRRTDGALWCWGDNRYSQVGDGTTVTPSATPVQVAALGPGVAEVALGQGHTCVRKTDRSVWCWGYNGYGQVTGDGTLGDGASPDQPRRSPVQVAVLGTSVVEIALGWNHTCARKADGSVWCWGNNTKGQVGDGTTALTRRSPVQVTALGTSAVEVSAGGDLSCARKTDGTLWCWGDNQYGQASGDGTAASPKTSPVQLACP